MSDDGSSREGGDEIRASTEPRCPDGGFSDIDTLLSALSNIRRRYVLYYLQDERTATLDEMARQIFAWEREIPIEMVSPDDAESVRAALYHNHLPVLTDAALVEYDERSEALRYRDPPKVLELLLWILARIDDSGASF